MKDKRSWIGYGGFIIVLHLLGFYFLFTAARHSPALWSTGFLAYTLGLRHAFDVDHIAAIDNTVRKLIQQRKNPLGVGFYFSLGHSTVVLLLAIATAFSVKWIQKEMPQMQEIGGVIGTIVSGSFLIIIGIINLIILDQLYKLFKQFRQGHTNSDEFERLLESRGLITRLMQPFFKFIGKSWHVYPLGFLFGLGFDTASEIALLAISAGAAKASISFMGILSFPILFAAGMCLLDTADGMFMTTAYKWAFSTPFRKLYYNLTVTSLAVVAALLIGLVELSQVISSKAGLNGGVWDWLNHLDFSLLGYVLVILFVLSWTISYFLWKMFRFEEQLN